MKKRIVLMALASSLKLTSKAQIYAGDPSVRLPTRDLYGTEVMGMSLAHAEMAARVAAWRQQQYEYYSEQAVEAYNERHWSGVIQNVNSALGTNYYSGFHFYLRGYAYEQLGYLKQAKKDYKKGKRYGCHEAATALNSLKEKNEKEITKTDEIMKKVLLMVIAIIMAITANAQYNVGTSSRYTDNYGNSTSTHRNRYGQTTGTSSSYTDAYGNTTTTHKNQYGQTIGTSTTYTDSYGNSTTTHRDRYGHVTGTDKSYTDSYGNTSTTYMDSNGKSKGSSNSYSDKYGNSSTTYKNSYGQSIGSSSGYTDPFGNTTTQQRSNNPNTTIWSW